MQRGQIFLSSGSWYLRYWIDESKDGEHVRRRACEKLARYSDAYRSKKDVLSLAEQFLSPVNSGRMSPDSSLTISEFTEKQFFDHIEDKINQGYKKPSTLKFYKDVYNNHLKENIGHIRLRDFNTLHAQELIDRIDKEKRLSHKSILRVKTGISAIFTFARQRNILQNLNPVQGVKVEGRKTKPIRFAYSLKEVLEMIEALPEPASTVVSVAAFTGLRAGEIRGLRWEDYDGKTLDIRRSVWRTHVVAPKTESSGDKVPVIPVLQTILQEHRTKVPNKPEAYIFGGERRGTPLHLDNLSRRVIAPALDGRWHGWHAFRRGLATLLHELNVQTEDIQEILRHSDVKVTRDSYIVIKSDSTKSALDRVNDQVMRAWRKGGKKGKRRRNPGQNGHKMDKTRNVETSNSRIK